MDVLSWYECTRGSEYRAPFTGTVYRCRGCDGLLDVAHDLDSLKTRSAAEWKALFADRAASSEWPYTSGVWSKHEWIHPRIERENIVSLGEGNTPLVRVSRLGEVLAIADLRLKQCWLNSSGSFENLGMTVLVSAINQTREGGEPVRGIACAANGDFSAALAAYCAAADVPAVVFSPIGETSIAESPRVRAHGQLVVALDTDVEGCRRIASQVADDCKLHYPGSMDSLRLEGEKMVAVELAQQLGWSAPDWVVLPSDNPGSIKALSRGFLMMRELGLVDRLPRIACVREKNIDLLYQNHLSELIRAKPTATQGNPTIAIRIEEQEGHEQATKLLCAFNGVVKQVSKEELAQVAAITEQTGLRCSSRTQMALAGLTKLQAGGEIHPADRVVVMSPEEESTAGHCEQSLNDGGPFPIAAVELPADPTAIADWIAQALVHKEWPPST